MTARGKGQRPPGPPTEPLPPVTVGPEFRARHICRGMPAGIQIIQQPPQGWLIRIVVGGRQGLGPVAFCAWCGLELIKDGA